MQEFALPRGSDRCKREEGTAAGMRIPFAVFLWGFLPWMILSLKGTGSGDLPLNSLPAPLVIVTHPADQVDCEDHIVSFTVGISGGEGALTFTWERQRPEEGGFTPIPSGAPGISYPAPGILRVANVGGHENPGGSLYRVTVSDGVTAITSNAALLTVNEITDVIPSMAYPSKTRVILCRGDDFSYTVTTAGLAPLAWQWKKYLSPGVWVNVTDNGVISGSQGPVLTFTGVTPAESGQYKVNLTFPTSSLSCHVESDTRERILTVQAPPEPPMITPPGAVCQGTLSPELSADSATGGSGAFSYQWQQSSDLSVWSNLSGATSLHYQPPLLTSSLWFRITATDTGKVSCGNVTSGAVFQEVIDCGTLSCRSVQDGIWHDRSTWETSPDGITWCNPAPILPTSAMRSIRIRDNHHVTVTQPVTADEVTVEVGAALTVPSGITFTHLHASPADGLLIDGNATRQGSLVARGVFNGVIRCRRYFSPARWTLIASPLKVTEGFQENAPAIRFDDVNQDYDLGWYQELGNAGWQYFTAVPGSLQPGRGYVIRTTATGGTEEGILTFTGTLQGTVNDTVSPMVYRSAPRHGWNGIGNPFTSAIGITASAATSENFLTRNASLLEDSYSAVYLWNQTGPYDGSQQYYKAIGNSGYNFSGFSFFGGDDPDYLQSGQGFLINVKENGRAVFSREMQLHAPAVKIKSAGQSWPGLVLTARQGNRERQTVVAFHESMTTGLDKTFDAGLLPTDNFRLYTLLVNGSSSTPFQTQCLPDHRYGELVIPVGINLPSGGEILLSATGILLPGDWIPFLEDRRRGVTVSLGQGNEGYRVHLEPGTAETDRFFLRFGERQVTHSPHISIRGGSEGRDSRCYTAVKDGKLVIGNGGAFARAALFDLTGRKVMEFPVDRDGPVAFPLPLLTGGLYLLRLEGGGEKLTVKVTIR